eukprot:CAMPEP_0176425096 /NCGR_PEP_ID=MMETSP0127-20121128/11207_1 /TAXON_ID=938130 /ORGANISM="Platyophrya macrostoma, Strain WH" /LENGTH=279 /DNA_ID=CAMNT_0017806235 /DNA_START=37 /DNA_END=876 /DNA_ORIENTATION=-
MRTSLILALFCCCVVPFALASGEDACAAAQSCKPWTSNNACVSNGRMTLQIIVDIWPDSTDTNSSSSLTDASQVVYPFCPVVDQFQGFRLEGAGQYSLNALVTNPLSTLTTTNISVKGLATAEENFEFPASQGAGQTTFTYLFNVLSDSSSEFGSGCTSGQVGVVSVLMLNFTMTNGVYTYGTVNGSTSGSPVNNGFVPTCQSGQCLFGDSACVGPPGAQNCARCFSATDNIAALDLKIWASYYGSDSNGRTFTSNQDNPLNYLQYATQSAYSTLTSTL